MKFIRFLLLIPVLALTEMQSASAQQLFAPVLAATSPDSDILGVTAFNNKVYFAANDGIHGHELWQSDGTEAGTRMLEDIAPGPFGSLPRAFIAFRDRLYFVANQQGARSGGHSGTELHYVSSKGQVEGVTMRHEGKNVWLSISKTASLIVWNDQLLFRGSTDLGNDGLWASDGVSESPTLLWSDSKGVPLSTPFRPEWIFPTARSLFLIDAEENIWGTSTDSIGMNLVLTPSRIESIGPIAALGEQLLFAQFTPEHGREPYLATIHPDSVRLLKDIRPGSGHAFNIWEGTRAIGLGESVLFAADDGEHGEELFVTDGSPEGTQLLADLNPGLPSSNPDRFLQMGTKILFTAEDKAHGLELWVTDGTTTGTRIVADLATGPESSNPRNVSTDGGLAYFSATTPSTGEEQFVTDGTPEGTRLFTEVVPGSVTSAPDQNALTESFLFFVANDGVHGRELWRADRLTGAAALVRDTASGTRQTDAASIRSLTALGDDLYFVANTAANGTELWQLPTGSDTPSMLQDLFPGNAGSHPEELTPLGGKLFFTAEAPQTGLVVWTFEPTTRELRPVFAPNTGLMNPHGLIAWNDGLYFVATHPDSGEELWCLKPPYEVPQMVSDICPGPCSAHPKDLSVTTNGLRFHATDASGIRKFWTTDGSADGTFPIGYLPESAAAAR